MQLNYAINNDSALIPTEAAPCLAESSMTPAICAGSTRRAEKLMRTRVRRVKLIQPCAISELARSALWEWHGWVSHG